MIFFGFVGLASLALVVFLLLRGQCQATDEHGNQCDKIGGHVGAHRHGNRLFSGHRE